MRAIAEAYPVLNHWNAFWYKYKTNTLEWFIGPPSVIIEIISNAFKAPIKEVTERKKVVGLRSGNVI